MVKVSEAVKRKYGGSVDVRIEGYINYVTKKGFRWYLIDIVSLAGQPLGGICVEESFLKKKLRVKERRVEYKKLKEVVAQLDSMLKATPKEQKKERMNIGRRMQEADQRMAALKPYHNEDIRKIFENIPKEHKRIRLHMGHYAR